MVSEINDKKHSKYKNMCTFYASDRSELMKSLAYLYKAITWSSPVDLNTKPFFQKLLHEFHQKLFQGLLLKYLQWFLLGCSQELIQDYIEKFVYRFLEWFLQTFMRYGIIPLVIFTGLPTGDFQKYLGKFFRILFPKLFNAFAKKILQVFWQIFFRI